MDLSVIIAYFNRADTVEHTLASIERARGDGRIEIILVDDGSEPPAADTIAPLLPPHARIVRQSNHGLLFARLTGLREARGEHVLFLDSDDCVGPEKFSMHLRALRETGADVVYSDSIVGPLGVPWAELRKPPQWEATEETSDPAVFFIRAQPPPHAPVFRTAWLRAVLERPLFPPSPLYNAVAEIWFYHVAATAPARIVKVPGIHNLVGQHDGARLTGCWEKMAVASLAVIEAFMRACPLTRETEAVRRLVGEKAFNAWRGLPYDFFSVYQERLLQLWRAAPRGSLAALGGRNFQRLARVFGPVAAGRLLRRLRGGDYASCRSPQGPEEFARQLALLDDDAASTR